MKRKPVKPFRRRDDDLKVIFQTNTKQTTLRKIVETHTMTKEEAEKFMKGEGCPCCPKDDGREPLDNLPKGYVFEDNPLATE